MNNRALRVLHRLSRRYDDHRRELPKLIEVERLLWRAHTYAKQRLHGYWPLKNGFSSLHNLESWTARNLGWSFPCLEACRLIRRVGSSSTGRIVDIGAGLGLWTKVLQREFGTDKVIGLDPNSSNEYVIQCSFLDWCRSSTGANDDDIFFASWLPCKGQDGESLSVQILDRVQSGQHFIYVGSGPKGPVGTRDFYEKLAAEFEECASEPLPRVYPAVFPQRFSPDLRTKTRPIVSEVLSKN